MYRAVLYHSCTVQLCSTEAFRVMWGTAVVSFTFACIRPNFYMSSDVCNFSLSHRKNVDDFTGPRERSDLGFITFDLSADILPIKALLCLIFSSCDVLQLLQRVFAIRVHCVAAHDCAFIQLFVDLSSFLKTPSWDKRTVWSSCVCWALLNECQ